MVTAPPLRQAVPGAVAMETRPQLRAELMRKAMTCWISQIRYRGSVDVALIGDCENSRIPLHTAKFVNLETAEKVILWKAEAALGKMGNVKLLTRELEVPNKTGMQVSESPQAAKVVNLQLEKEDKYKQLLMAAEQGPLLEQRKTHTELDWRQCGNAENHRYQQSEDLTPDLCVAGEQTSQSDNKSYLRKDIPVSEIQKLQEQNANLRAVIAQMRKEMESLDEQTPSSVPRREQTAPGHAAEIPLLTAGVPLGRAEGSLCTDQVSGRSTSSNMNAGLANLGCVVKPGTEKGSNNRVMDKEMIDFGSASDDCCPGGGVQCGVSCTPQGTQNKLKEAARAISVLSQEKQQLTEMGNRTDLGMILKEGLWHPTSPKRCTVCVGSDGLSPRELVKRTQCQLSSLRHLQRKLITQVQPDSSAGNYGPKQQKAAATSSKVVQSQPPKESPGQAQQVWISSSRARSLCQALEFEVTRSTKQLGESQEHSNATGRRETPDAHLAIRGTKLEAQQKLKPRTLPCTYPTKRKISPKVAKIRNYNIKD
ncbi:hypothetical protein ASZ78_013688 [Callipepla squamata]|uniref:Coiled-coil domain-containing protein 57 n=1 Tax=Callipepla squamata TaxID=9009 RepID=A0A226N0L2_CALSU|nr:hypothetical protein ASZ78_013688 [Callipepla squamata]